VSKRGQASTDPASDQNLAAPELLIEVEKPMGNITTSTSNGLKIGGDDSGKLWLADKVPSDDNVIKALSKAQAYFSRPKNLFPRPTAAETEYGSLYSPYWQARLLPNSILEQGASILLSGWP
jgi:hypothetical protein